MTMMLKKVLSHRTCNFQMRVPQQRLAQIMNQNLKTTKGSRKRKAVLLLKKNKLKLLTVMRMKMI